MSAFGRAHLHAFRPLTIGDLVPQKQGIDWLLKALDRCQEGRSSPETDGAVRLYQQFLEADHIDTRTTVLDDYRHQDWDRMSLYRALPDSPSWDRPSLQRRMSVFREQALRLVEEALEGETSVPDYLIQISCTGYDSPHATQRVAGRKGWGSQSRLLHVGHMGCYAALPVSSLAGELLQSSKEGARATLIHIELCTLHLVPGALQKEQIVMNTLFGDGAIRFDVSRATTEPSFSLLNYMETIIPETEKAMTWCLNDSAFLMSLSRNVPVELVRKTPTLVEELLKPFGAEIKDCIFAIHPGGPRIIELVANTLGLSPEQTHHCRYILRRRGNMSSCTLPHIWNEILDDSAVASGTLVVSLGFGPGLTIAANVMRKEAAC